MYNTYIRAVCGVVEETARVQRSSRPASRACGRARGTLRNVIIFQFIMDSRYSILHRGISVVEYAYENINYYFINT